jgi:hypothetical protein
MKKKNSKNEFVVVELGNIVSYSRKSTIHCVKNTQDKRGAYKVQDIVYKNYGT